MFRLVRRVARLLERVPFWLKLPLVVMEVTVLGVMLTWLYVTRSVETLTVPDVAGMRLKQARQVFASKGLSYTVVKRNSTRTEENRIIRQAPRPGNRIKETRSVEIYVSSGPELVKVPDITGQTPLEARNNLYRRSGRGKGAVGTLLNLGNVARVYHPEVETGKIILQDPRQGRQVIRGRQVDVLVSKGPWPRRTVIPELKGKKVHQARQILRENHLNLGDTRYILEKDQPPSVVLRQSPPPGRIVRRGRPVSLTVNLSAWAEVPPVRYTFVRVTPPLSLTEGRLRVNLVDRAGSRVVYNELVDPGKEIKFLVSIRGDAQLIIYWEGEIYQFRRLEYQR